MMAHKILVLFLILLSYTSSSTSTCRLANLVWDHPSFSYNPMIHSSTDVIYCSEINLNKETPLSKEYDSTRTIHPVLIALDIHESNISKLYDNTLEGFQYLEVVSLPNVSLHEIDQNVFVKWTNLSNVIFTYNELTTLNFYLPPQIQYLNISHNKISHLKEFQNYNNLLELDLSYNSIISIESIGPFKALRIFDLSHNHISSLANITWANGQIIDSFILNNNNLEFIPQNIETMLIKYLDLSYNNISDFDCTNVTKSINLSHNKFTEICNFSTTLNNIDFSYNKLTHIYEYTFKNLNILEYLNISGNYIETIYPDAFHDLINLERLDLSDNVISELPRGLFYHLENLRSLYIAMNYIEQFEHGTFTGLNRLQVLNVSDNKIDNLDAIYSLKHLLELNIVDNNLYELDVNEITKHFPFLEKVNFNVHSKSCEELMVYLLEFKEKAITVEKGDNDYYENVNGIYCYSDPDFKNKKRGSNNNRMGHIANYLSKISVALILILVALVFVIILITFTLYRVYTKHHNQTEIDRNLHSCSLKLLSENDPLN